ncbi:TonB-dependent receptor [Rodentibacter pneumotropicus]|uniref:TonB-dependent receptor n=1 Tax=Rodentibacter pneumotropicus TaxID=758 RepID=A0A3S4Y4U8_9PAST|nr:TonB-dependent receptor [Rodentibacter pneumotropicus]
MQVVPGISHTQAYFFDASTLSKVEVHDSNISASLGGFMGGAVVAKTKQYNGKDSVSLKYRTTNSGWAKMNADNSAQNLLDKIRPDADGVAAFQPKYRKQTFNIVLEKGLTDNLGMVLGYSKRHSRIQQNRLIGYDTEAKLNKQNHLRNSDNLLLNFNLAASEKDRVELGFRYSNYKEQNILPPILIAMSAIITKHSVRHWHGCIPLIRVFGQIPLLMIISKINENPPLPVSRRFPFLMKILTKFMIMKKAVMVTAP